MMIASKLDQCGLNPKIASDFDINYYLLINLQKFSISFICWRCFLILFVTFKLVINEIAKCFVSFNQIMAVTRTSKHITSNRESFKNLILNNWMIAVLVNALIALFFIIIFCYFCIRKKCCQKNNSLLLNSDKLSSQDSSYFIRRNTSANSSLSSLKYNSPGQEIFTIQPVNNALTNGQNMNAAETESHKSSNEHRFRNLARIASHTLSKVRDLNYTPREGSLSFQGSAPSTPPIYDPPKEFNMLNFKSTAEVEENDLKQSESQPVAENNGDSGFDDQIVPTTAESFLIGEVNEAKEAENMEANVSNVKDVDINETRNSINFNRLSKAIQTSPSLWLEEPRTVDLKQSKSLDLNAYLNFNSSEPDENNETEERKYFIYLITESNPYFIKNCIGKINLPSRQSFKLSELRELLLKAEDQNIHDVLKKHRSFRFLTETYRFVSQNESSTSIDQIYPTRGIFIKLTAPDLGMLKADMNKNIRTSRKSIPSFIALPPVKEVESTKSEVKESRKDGKIRKTYHPEKSFLKDTINVTTKKDSLYCDTRKTCENLNCHKKATLRCKKCNTTYYCSFRCKKEDYHEHRIICAKPPWKF